MSAAKKIGIAVSDHSVRLYLSANTVQHLGGSGTRVRFLTKRVSEGHWTVSIREDKQTSYKIAQHGSKDHPFKIETADPPYPLDRWPHTPPTKPVYIPVTYDENPKRQISFEVRADELSGRVDAKNLQSALKPLANRMKEVLDKPPIVHVAEQIAKVGVPFFSTQPQATPFKPIDAPVAKQIDEIAKRYAAEGETKEDVINRLKNTPALREADIPPVHIRLNDVLRILNSLLTVELNDIELFVEQVDEAGGVVKTIPLPVPSQMRIKGRRIREETFG